jgi:hypothetical protein
MNSHLAIWLLLGVRSNLMIQLLSHLFFVTKWYTTDNYSFREVIRRKLLRYVREKTDSSVVNSPLQPLLVTWDAEHSNYKIGIMVSKSPSKSDSSVTDSTFDEQILQLTPVSCSLPNSMPTSMSFSTLLGELEISWRDKKESRAYTKVQNMHIRKGGRNVQRHISKVHR